MMKFHAVKTLSEGIQDSRGLQKSFSMLLATHCLKIVILVTQYHSDFHEYTCSNYLLLLLFLQASHHTCTVSSLF